MDTQETTTTTTTNQPKIKFNSSKDNLTIEVEGEISVESLSLLQELLDGKRADKTKELEELKIKAQIKEKVDGVTVAFLGCAFCSLVFVVQILVSTVSNNFTHPKSETGFKPSSFQNTQIR